MKTPKYNGDPEEHRATGYGRPGKRLADIANELARSGSGYSWDERIEGFFQLKARPKQEHGPGEG